MLDNVGVITEQLRTLRNAIRLILSSYGRLNERGHDLGRRPSTVLDCFNDLPRCDDIRTNWENWPR